jgi:hypothetical protein
MAPRLRPPSWRDPRLAVGVLLVLGSTAFGARVVAAADHSVPVYLAAQTLPTGTALASADLKVARVHLDAAVAGYLSAVDPPPRGVVLTRTVASGEMIPLSAVGTAEATVVRPVSIPLDGALPRGLQVGARVDIWSSAKDRAAGGTGFAAPKQLASAAEVFAVRAQGTGLTSANGAAVETLVDQSGLTAVLDALANGDRLAIVVVPGSSPGSAAHHP